MPIAGCAQGIYCAYYEGFLGIQNVNQYETTIDELLHAVDSCVVRLKARSEIP